MGGPWKGLWRMDGILRVAGTYAFEAYRLDPVRRTLMHDGLPVDLTARLFDTLLYLVENHARVVQRDELERAVWGRRHMDGVNVAMAISSLRKALQGDAGTPGLIATVTGQGYRLAADVTFEPSRDAEAAVTLADRRALPAHEAARVAWWRGRRVAFVVALLLLAGSAAAIWRATPVRERAGAKLAFTPPPRSIAVMAFTNVGGDPAQTYFSDGISEELINALSQVGGLQVAARSSSFSFKQKQASVQEIARRLNVGAVLRGSVGRDGGKLRIEARLLDGVTGAELWSHRYDRDQGGVLEVQAELAKAVTSALQVRLAGGDVAGLTLGGTTNPRALDAYLRGVAATRTEAQNEAGFRREMALFDQAVALDPSFAIAQATRARTLWTIAAKSATSDRAFVNGLKDAALEGAQKAVSLAPDLADAHVALGFALGAHRPDFRRQEAEFARARELAPGDASIARQYSTFESFAGHQAAAVAAAEQAVALDPVIPESYVRLAWASYWAKLPDASLAALRHARQLGATDRTTLAYLEGLDDLLLGHAEAARLACHEDNHWGLNACMAMAYHALGKQNEAETEVAKLKAYGPQAGAFPFAMIYAQWGRYDDALTWLQKSYDLPDIGIIQIEAEPWFDPMRQMPRFKEIEKLLDVAR
jgi:TolB-like protein/DNA-binding winged helix-turn-helix (wHTH) protein